MSELHARSRLLSLSLHICFSLLSHPLYFSYFVFFFPYLLTLLSFLFPLLASISLLLFSLHSLSPRLFLSERSDDSAVSESKVEIFFAFERLFDDFDVCKYENGDNLGGNRDFPPLLKDVEENREAQSAQILEFKENEEHKAKLFGKKKPDEAEDYEKPCSRLSKTQSMEESEALVLGSNGGSSSTRKEREWRRTLAGKLYEERHKVEQGSEEMDLLWETYENQSNPEEKTRRRKRSLKKSNNGGLEQTNIDEDSTVDLCCLQAFKLSTGKMNLGMGGSNLAKFSKALRGIGWFHKVKIKS